MSVLIIHEVEKAKPDKTAEMINQAVGLFKEDTDTWRKLNAFKECLKRGEVICLSVAEDYKRVISVRSCTDSFFTYELICNESGKPEKGVNALNWNVLKDARFKEVELPPEENDECDE